MIPSSSVSAPAAPATDFESCPARSSRVTTQLPTITESPNGHAHCLQLMLGTSQSIPVADGELLLGTWQRIFLVELDGPRDARQVVIQVLGTTD